ncbi:gluconolactonase [Ruegeria sp. ANG-R]|uniref:SMP-30/gluconolactonase/LRE family protein n=1 Tax=Ruegeria sp. ANG-R TaxID=1577903 RepID=UPI00057D59DD|nr:SMP-30/gluconolactonase/LRE family protein [Ruegeria sp. ANG-R]KIC37084.1 gluconolactonase [Ruegeria sp. ANG-R]
MSHIYDDRPCELGEGPLWHPERQQIFWFDIIGKRLMSIENNKARVWEFDEHVSSAGWVARDTLLVASETGLWRFELERQTKDLVVPLEADNPVTRSNDGRADPWGGFWIGTMGKNAEANAGSIYRYWKGEFRALVRNVTISNAICFAPDRSCAYYSDTATRQVMRWKLDAQTGWPVGKAALFLDLQDDGLNPDGAVVDSSGNIWIAQWGAGRVAAYDQHGQFLKAVDFDAKHTSCPSFGGDGLTTLFCTTARQGLDVDTLGKNPINGMTLAAFDVGQGQAEHRVIL